VGAKSESSHGGSATRLAPSSLRALSHTVRAIWHHPLGRGPGIIRFVKWQVGTRILGPVRVEVPWIAGTRLLLERGMQGATGNLYCELLEYTDMSFVLDVLRPSDLFVDVGANVGVYTVLASGACRARTVALEPGLEAYERLQRHIVINGLQERVTTLMLGASSGPGKVRFRVDSDTVNRIASTKDSDGVTATINVDSLDNILGDDIPAVIKIDVEGWEQEVLRGATRILGSDDLLALVVEVNDAGLQYGFSPEDTIELLREHGFVPYSYLPRLKRLEPGADTEANNVIFIRDANAVSERLTDAGHKHTGVC
jgi:FkbM family methyltransferase